MGRVLTPRERHDETYDWSGRQVREYVTSHYTSETTVLDVGAGRGKYRDLLPEYGNVDACEIWEPVVDDENLRGRYRAVYVDDVVNLTTSGSYVYEPYTIVIMGDVLEHMTVDDAHAVLARFIADESDVLVVVPYAYPQGEEDGNVYQRHIQDDLTPELMVERYHELRLIALDTRSWLPFKGLYRSA